MMNCKSVLNEQSGIEIDAIDVSLFGALTPQQRDVLLAHLDHREYRSGERVFIQGGLPSEIYILASGSVDIISEHDGVSRIQGSYSAGDTFGESAFIGIQPHINTAIVRGVKGAEVCVLSRDALMALQKSDNDLFSILMMNLAREVSRKYHCALSHPEA